jgi:NH3-dependent NAD+ synthetase
MPVLDVEELIKARVRAIQWYHETTGIKRAQLDVSGGVDSAVMLGLLARTA